MLGLDALPGIHDLNRVKDELSGGGGVSLGKK